MLRPSKPTHPLLPLRPLLALLAGAVTLLLCAGCGGGSEGVARLDGVSGSSIDKATLNHWMRSMAGGDFRQSIGEQGPSGLASEPADYSSCDSAAKSIAPKGPTGQPKLSNAQIDLKCHELHRALKAQALNFLISVRWAVAEGAEEGIKVSDAEVKREFARYRKEFYPTEQDLREYLKGRQWALSDILYQLKRNILIRKILPSLEAKVKRAGGGEQAYARFALEKYKRLLAKTSCSPGYVVPNCRQYRGPSVVSPAPDVILEGMVGKAG